MPYLVLPAPLPEPSGLDNLCCVLTCAPGFVHHPDKAVIYCPCLWVQWMLGAVLVLAITNSPHFAKPYF